MIKIVLSNAKGGVSKTTTANALASGLRTLNFRVLSIDLDPQGNLSASAGFDETGITKSIKGIFEGEKITDLICESSIGDMIPCDLEMLDADRTYTKLGAVRTLKKALADIEDKYDYCIIDTPPNAGVMSLNGLIAADYVIIPVNASYFSVKGIGFLYNFINEVREEENPGLKIMGILLTKYNPRTNFGKEAAATMGEIATRMNTTCFNSTIRQAVAIEVAQADYKDIYSSAPNSKVAADYMSFVKEVVERSNR